MRKESLLDLFGTVLIGIVCPFALLIDKNPIVLANDTGGKEVGK